MSDDDDLGFEPESFQGQPEEPEDAEYEEDEEYVPEEDEDDEDEDDFDEISQSMLDELREDQIKHGLVDAEEADDSDYDSEYEEDEEYVPEEDEDDEDEEDFDGITQRMLDELREDQIKHGFIKPPPPPLPPIDSTTQTSVVSKSVITTGGLEPFRLNELNYQYFYRENDSAPAYTKSANQEFVYSYQAVGVKIPDELYSKLVLSDSILNSGCELREHSLMNEKVIRYDVPPAQFKLTFSTDCVQPFDTDILQDHREWFPQEVCRNYFPEFKDVEDTPSQFNLFATYQIKNMCIDLYDKYHTNTVYLRRDVTKIDDPDGFINDVLPAWLKANSFRIYSEDGSKSIQLMCPFFGKKATINKEKIRHYYTFKFLEWKDGQICPYSYCVELDPVRDQIQLLRLVIDGVVYRMYVQLADALYYSEPHPERNEPISWLPDGQTNIYYREVNLKLMFKKNEKPDQIRFYDPVEQTVLIYDDFSTNGDCFPITMVTTLMSLQPDMIRYLNLFRYAEYSIHEDGHIAHDSVVKRGLFTGGDDNLLKLFSNRLRHAYPLDLSHKVLKISGDEVQTEPDLELDENDHVIDMDPYLYWSPNIILEGDMHADLMDDPSYDRLVTANFCTNKVYDFTSINPGNKNFIEFGVTKGFRMKNDSDIHKREYLYSLFDRLGCNSKTPTFYPILSPGHISILTCVWSGNYRNYVILEPQIGSKHNAYDWLKNLNPHLTYASPHRVSKINLLLTRTCRPHNLIRSLASPLILYSGFDPAFYKGNLLPICQQSLSKSYLLLRELPDTSSLTIANLFEREDFELDVQRSATRSDPVDFSVAEWFRSKLARIPLIGSYFQPVDLVDHFINFITFLSSPLEETISNILYWSKPYENPYMQLAINLLGFDSKDISYDSSVNLFYLRSTHQQLKSLYDVLYHGLKVLYVSPEQFSRVNLIYVNQFMELLKEITSNVGTVDFYNIASSKSILRLYQDKLQPYPKDLILNLLYSKPVFRTLCRYHVDHPALLPSSAIPMDRLVERRLATSKPVLDYRSMYGPPYRPLVYLRYLMTTGGEKLSLFIQTIIALYQEVVQHYTMMGSYSIKGIITDVLTALDQQISVEIPEPALDEHRDLLTYFIFIVNLYRFQESSLFQDQFA